MQQFLTSGTKYLYVTVTVMLSVMKLLLNKQLELTGDLLAIAAK